MNTSIYIREMDLFVIDATWEPPMNLITVKHCLLMNVSTGNADFLLIAKLHLIRLRNLGATESLYESFLVNNIDRGSPVIWHNL